MTMPGERTDSVIGAIEFLIDLTKDKTLPDLIRLRAKHLLRHYPSIEEIRRVGRLEVHRQQEIARLTDAGFSLPPVLAVWPCSQPFFIDSEFLHPQLPAVLQNELLPASKTVMISDIAGRGEVAELVHDGAHLWRPVISLHGGCLNPSYRDFVLQRKLTVFNATRIFGSLNLAEEWIEKPAFGLGKRQPCEVLLSVEGYTIVRNLLARIEYGIY